MERNFVTLYAHKQPRDFSRHIMTGEKIVSPAAPRLVYLHAAADFPEILYRAEYITSLKSLN